jgi:hypothetical protein
MYGPPSSGECDFGANYTTTEQVTDACPFEFNHAKIIISDDSSVLRYHAVVWKIDDKDATMLCFPNNTVIEEFAPYADNITKAHFDGDGFYYIINNTDTVADGVENLVSPGFFYAKDSIVDASIDDITMAWNYTNATGAEFLDLCALMDELGSIPSSSPSVSPSVAGDNDVVEPLATDSSPSSAEDSTNPPSSAHMSTHWQVAMVVQAIVLFTSLP